MQTETAEADLEKYLSIKSNYQLDNCVVWISKAGSDAAEMQVNQYTNSDNKNADEQEKIGKITGVYYDTTKKVNDIVYTEFTRYEIDHDGFGGHQINNSIINTTAQQATET